MANFHPTPPPESSSPWSHIHILKASMSCIEGAIRQRLPKGQCRLKSSLVIPLVGGVVRAYLPQVWVIITERETLSVEADTQGDLRISRGELGARDGTITICHDILANALQTGASPLPSSYHVVFHTAKGKRSFEFLRSQFGL
jgi:hypothetical protein